MLNRKRIGIIVFVLFLAAAWFFNRKPPELRGQDEIQLKPIGGVGIELASTIHLYNPNLLSITIGKIHEKFYIKGNFMGELDTEINQGIPGFRETELPVNIRFKKEDLNLAMATDSGTTIQVAIEGQITYQYFIKAGTLLVHVPAQ